MLQFQFRNNEHINIWVVRFFVFFLACMSIVSQLCARQARAYNGEAEVQFLDAVKQFQKRLFIDAASSFTAVANIRPVHQRTTASLVMGAKAFFELRNYDESKSMIREFLDKFPSSSYVPDAHYTLALDLMMQKNFGDAAEQFLQVLEISSDTTLVHRSQRLFLSFAGEQLSFSALSKLRESRHSKEVLDLVTFVLAQRYVSRGENEQARAMLASLSHTSHHLVDKGMIEELASRLATGAQTNIGIVLPLHDAVAQEILDGIHIGFDMSDSKVRSQAKIGLQVVDAGKDSLSVSSAIRHLTASADVVGIVGPMYSNAVAWSGSYASMSHVPLISPTANADGIAAAGNYVFQANPDYTTRGKAMARYAVQHLGYTKLAILSATETASKLVADAFKKEAERLGATILAYELYAKDTNDLRDQFMDLRKIGSEGEPRVSFAGKMLKEDVNKFIRAGADKQLVREARKRGLSIEVTKLFGPRGKFIADSLHLTLITPKAHGENIEFPVTAIQGLFISIGSSEEIGTVTSQLSYFNILTQILGNSEWDDASQLEMNKRSLNNCLFLSDSYVDPDDSVYIEFGKMFAAKMKKQPTRNTLYGYDTIRMILQLMDEGATTRESLTSSLRNMHEYHGLHSDISFDQGRVNSNVHIVKYESGSIKKIADITVN